MRIHSIEAIAVADARSDRRFLWVRGIDQRRLVGDHVNVHPGQVSAELLQRAAHGQRSALGEQGLQVLRQWNLDSAGERQLQFSRRRRGPLLTDR